MAEKPGSTWNNGGIDVHMVTISCLAEIVSNTEDIDNPYLSPGWAAWAKEYPAEADAIETSRKEMTHTIRLLFEADLFHRDPERILHFLKPYFVLSLTFIKKVLEDVFAGSELLRAQDPELQQLAFDIWAEE